MLLGMLLQQSTLQYRIVHNYIKSWQIRNELEIDLDLVLQDQNPLTCSVIALAATFIADTHTDDTCVIGDKITNLIFTHKKVPHYVLFASVQQRWDTCVGPISKQQLISWNFSQS